MVEGRRGDITKIVGAVLDPLLISITERMTFLSSSIDMAVFFLNVLYEIIVTLSVYEFVDDKMERLNASVEAQIETLTSEQVRYFLNCYDLKINFVPFRQAAS